MVNDICLNEALLDGAKEVFETMIFMDLQGCDTSDLSIKGDALLSTITFKGTLEGCLAICFDETSSKAVTANMLGHSYCSHDNFSHCC